MKHFKIEPYTSSEDVFDRNKLPANCADISVPIMNPLIRKWSHFKKVSHVERKLYNIQTSNLRATSAVARIADLTLLADQSSTIVNSTEVGLTSLDATTLLGHAEAQLNAARIVNVKDILSEEVRDICNMDEKPTKFIFEDDLSKRLKNAKEAYRICSQMSKSNQAKFRGANASRSSSTFMRPP